MPRNLNRGVFTYVHLIFTAQLLRLVYKRAPSAAPIALTSSCVSMCSSSALPSSCRVKTLTEKASGSSLLSSILRCERKGRGKRAEEVESRGTEEKGRGDGGRVVKKKREKRGEHRIFFFFFWKKLRNLQHFCERKYLVEPKMLWCKYFYA